MENIQHPTSKACIRFPVCLGIGTTNLRRMRLHHQGAAGILPAVLSSDRSAGKMPAAHWGSWKAPLSFFRMHWDHEPRTSRTVPATRCCRRLVGRAFLRCLCRQDAGSTLRFMERRERPAFGRTAFEVGCSMFFHFITVSSWSGLRPARSGVCERARRSTPDRPPLPPRRP